MLTEHIPRFSEPDLRGWEWRYFRRIAGGDHPTILRGHSNDVTKVQFSPDGRYLASRDVDSRLLLWDLQPSPAHIAGARRSPFATLDSRTTGAWDS